MAHLGNFGHGGIKDLGSLGSSDDFSERPPEYSDHQWKGLTNREKWEASMQYNLTVAHNNIAILIAKFEHLKRMIMSIAIAAKVKPERINEVLANPDDINNFVAVATEQALSMARDEEKKNKKVSKILDETSDDKAS